MNRARRPGKNRRTHRRRQIDAVMEVPAVSVNARTVRRVHLIRCGRPAQRPHEVRIALDRAGYVRTSPWIDAHGRVLLGLDCSWADAMTVTVPSAPMAAIAFLLPLSGQNVGSNGDVRCQPRRLAEPAQTLPDGRPL